MRNCLWLLFLLPAVMPAVDLPTKPYLDLHAVKAMVAAAEAEEGQRGVHVSLCVVDESGNLLFFQLGDGAPLNTIDFAQKKARHAAMYGMPSKAGQDAVKAGKLDVMAFPDYFPNQGGLPIKVNGRVVGGIAASGSKSEIDEAIAQAGLDGLAK